MSEPADEHDPLHELVGQVFDKRYRIDAMLGAGGMGAVFRAHHLGLGQDVALKVLRPELSAGKSAAIRFQREARSASRLDHPNCVRVTDFGELDDGTKYLVMQMLEGRELKQMLGHPWLPSEAVDATLQILAGLEHAHRHGVVHRDLKPENVFVTKDHAGVQQLKLVDFGIAKIVDDTGAEAKLTRTGMVFGTPRYMSPEQATGGKVDARTDLYAVGLILYEMLAGRPPFEADDAAALVRMHILMPPPPLPDALPESLRQVVSRLLEKSRADRHPDASQVIAALAVARAEVASKGVGAIVAVPAAVPVATARLAPAPPAPTAATVSSPPPTLPPTHATAPAITGAVVPGRTLPSQVTPGYTMPAYGPAPTAPPPRRSLLPWLIAGAALIALLGVGVGVGLAGGDREVPVGTSATSGPEANALEDDTPEDREERDDDDDDDDEPKKEKKEKKPKKNDKHEEKGDKPKGKAKGKKH